MFRVRTAKMVRSTAGRAGEGAELYFMVKRDRVNVRRGVSGASAGGKLDVERGWRELGVHQRGWQK